MVSVHVADRDPAFREPLAQALRRLPAEVVTFESGAELYSRVARDGPDLIVMDVDLEEMNGFEVFGLLLRDHPERPLPVVFLTDFDNSGIAQELLQRGALAYLLKNAPLDEIVRTLESLLEERRKPAAAPATAPFGRVRSWRTVLSPARLVDRWSGTVSALLASSRHGLSSLARSIRERLDSISLGPSLGARLGRAFPGPSLGQRLGRASPGPSLRERFRRASPWPSLRQRLARASPIPGLKDRLGRPFVTVRELGSRVPARAVLAALAAVLLTSAAILSIVRSGRPERVIALVESGSRSTGTPAASSSDETGREQSEPREAGRRGGLFDTTGADADQIGLDEWRSALRAQILDDAIAAPAGSADTSPGGRDARRGTSGRAAKPAPPARGQATAGPSARGEGARTSAIRSDRAVGPVGHAQRTPQPPGFLAPDRSVSVSGGEPSPTTLSRQRAEVREAAPLTGERQRPAAGGGKLRVAGTAPVRPGVLDSDRDGVPDIRPPVLLHRVQAEYPRELEGSGTRGTVVLEVLVGSDGRAERVQVTRSSGHGALDQAAVEAVRRVRWQPALGVRGARPYPVALGITFQGGAGSRD